MKKYCCESFESRAEVPREMGLNIRIVKITEDLALAPEDLKNPYRIFMTSGYELDTVKDNKWVIIRFCPFCGQNLSKRYTSDAFLNEKPENLIVF
jgi:hypothetical protein